MSSPAPLPGDDCPLPVSQQRRNMLLYGVLWGLYYLAAPITYVGVTHANLLRGLGEKDTIANFPSAAYQWLGALPILVAWFFPQPRVARPMLVSCLVAIALVSGLTAAALWMRMPRNVLVSMVIAHGLILGIASGLLYPAQWEIVRRGVSSSRRGALMALAFGAGPVLACVGSLGQQIILTGQAHGVEFGSHDFPLNYAILFGLATPILLVAALSSSLFVVPAAATAEEPASQGEAIVAGAKDFLSSRPIVLGVLCYVLVASGGNAIMQTVSLAAPERIAGKSALQSGGDAAGGNVTVSPATPAAKPAAKSDESATVGYQNELRFGFKAIAGVLLGWLLARTHPKAALLATTGTLIVAMIWALFVTGKPYLVAMGLLGAGELYGAYYPNYVVSASPRHRVRLNVAYLTLIGSVIGFASILFGRINDLTGSRDASMWLATATLVVTMGIVVVGLPKDPRPEQIAESSESSDTP